MRYFVFRGALSPSFFCKTFKSAWVPTLNLNFHTFSSGKSSQKVTNNCFFSFLEHTGTSGDRDDFETPNSSLHSPVAQQQPAETATSNMEQKTEHKFRQGFSNHIRFVKWLTTYLFCGVDQRFLKSYVSTTLEILCSERQKTYNLVMRMAIC